ncbi:MAG TPA: RDD family protein, partial [Propionibacteriaceae bacterium]|nr:RDD family protein [Propionibacteriaceae bacterium]
RAVGAVLDAIIVFATFTLGFAAVNLLSTVVLGISLDQDRTGIVATVAFAVWWFSYSFVCLAVSGRTVGKGLIGIRVVGADGQSVAVRGAFVRTLTFPLSILFLGLGFVPLVVRRDHRALHDLLAGTCVVSDWGDRPALLSGPLTAFLRRASPDTAPLG